MEYTQAHLAGITAAELAAAVGISERTLRRRFIVETGTTWPRYLHRSRLMRGAALLAKSQRNVLEIAIEVGFDSASAFGRAFRAFTSENPNAYRKRVHTTRSTAPAP